MAKERVAELEQLLRDAAKRQEPLAEWAIELVKLTAEAVKESLVTAEGDDMLRVQGAARALDRLHKTLTKTPPSITENQ